MVEIFEIFSTSFQPTYNKILWLHVSKNSFSLKFGICTRNGSFGAFLVKTWSKPFGSLTPEIPLSS